MWHLRPRWQQQLQRLMLHYTSGAPADHSGDDTSMPQTTNCTTDFHRQPCQPCAGKYVEQATSSWQQPRYVWFPTDADTARQAVLGQALDASSMNAAACQNVILPRPPRTLDTVPTHPCQGAAATAQAEAAASRRQAAASQQDTHGTCQPIPAQCEASRWRSDELPHVDL